MRNNYLTKAYIQKKENLENSGINFNISISNNNNFQNFPFLLIIQSTTESHIRLTIYPIMKERIIKLSLTGQNISNVVIELLSNILKKYDIIHNSGLLKKKKDFFYECYLNLSISEAKSKDLKASLDKIKNIFKEIKIEEIGLKK